MTTSIQTSYTIFHHKRITIHRDNPMNSLLLYQDQCQDSQKFASTTPTLVAKGFEDQ
jgi:hypothetical protein